jgi:hypothetical protein
VARAAALRNGTLNSTAGARTKQSSSFHIKRQRPPLHGGLRSRTSCVAMRRDESIRRSPLMEVSTMNRFQFGLAGALLALALMAPFGYSMAAQDNNSGSSTRAAGALALPVTGSVAGGGAFSGTVTINRFAMQGGQLVAIGFVRGSVTNSAGIAVASGMRPVTLPVTLGRGVALTSAAMPLQTARMVTARFAGANEGRWMRVQAQTCGVLHLDLGPVALNLLGFNVSLSAVTLDISGDSAGPLGNLVCQVIALLGTVGDVVGLLNSILGLLTGLLGGLTGGLGA